MSKKIIIAKDFSKFPGPRYIRQGPNSGELFRDTKLYPAFIEAYEKGSKLEIDLDGVAGYGSSFLEESFGGLVRKLVRECRFADKGAASIAVLNTLILSYHQEPYHIDRIHNYIKGIRPKMAYA